MLAVQPGRHCRRQGTFSGDASWLSPPIVPEAEVAASLFTCEVCNHYFSSLEEVVSHPCGGEHATKPEPQQYQCRFCPYTSHCKWRVGRHERTHSGFRPFACPHCGQRFTESSSLKRHLRLRSKKGFCELRKRDSQQGSPAARRPQQPQPQQQCDPGPFVCADCGKGFTRKSGLDFHQLRHTQERPYACRVCQRGFADPGNASRHEKTVHGRQYPLHCPHCGQGCWHRPHLLRHLRTQHPGAQEEGGGCAIVPTLHSC